MEKKHIHLFIHKGGGCMMIKTTTSNPPCDDYYECDCGLKFTVYSDRIGHKFLPETIFETTPSEAKKAELDAQSDVDMGFTPN